jgi:ubiquinone/menaquinone biosynthesis C-methylase UbiE
MSTGIEIDGQRIAAEDDSFGLVFSACVFHHIPHDEHIHWLSELYRVTRKGGMIGIFEHNPLNPLTVYAVKHCPLDDNAHLIRAKELVERYRESGWKEPQVTFHLFFPRALAGLRRIEPFLGGVPFGAQYSVTAIKADSRIAG